MELNILRLITIDLIGMLTDATYSIADKAYASEAIRISFKQDNIITVILNIYLID